MRVKRSNQYIGSQEEKWAGQIGEARIAKLKEVCEYNNDLWPYWSFVLRFNVGPDAKGSCYSWSSIAKELGITENEAHFYKWVAMHILGRELVDSGRKERKAISQANAYLGVWSRKKKAEAQEALRQDMFERWKQKNIPGAAITETKLSGLKKILEDTKVHERILKSEITQILSVIMPLREELNQWERELKRCEEAVQKLRRIQDCLKALDSF